MSFRLLVTDCYPEREGEKAEITGIIQSVQSYSHPNFDLSRVSGYVQCNLLS